MLTLWVVIDQAWLDSVLAPAVDAINAGFLSHEAGREAVRQIVADDIAKHMQVVEHVIA